MGAVPALRQVFPLARLSVRHFLEWLTFCLVDVKGSPDHLETGELHESQEALYAAEMNLGGLASQGPVPLNGNEGWANFIQATFKRVQAMGVESPNPDGSMG